MLNKTGEIAFSAKYFDCWLTLLKFPEDAETELLKLKTKNQDSS